MSSRYRPPFSVTATIVSQVAAIGERIGHLRATERGSERLRRINRIRTIRGSLAIEGNTLSEAQIAAIRDGKPVVAPAREVQEARNALAAYDRLPRWQPTNERNLLAAHAALMKGLIDKAGHYRIGGVGVMLGKRVVHMAPPASRVPVLMSNLLRWLRETDQHPLIASSVFHYEFEFIHPFSDGNGRMGRLWQTLILSHWNPLFADVPLESLVHTHQTDYYAALRDSTRRSDSAVFIEFMLARLLEAIAVAGGKVEGPPKTLVKTLVKTRVKTEEQILALLRQQPNLTLAELASHLDKSISAIERAARRLREAERLRYVGPQKGGHWEVGE